MKRFKSILVGVDLDRGGTPQAALQEPAAQINLDTALRLAHLCHAELRLFSVSNRSDEGAIDSAAAPEAPVVRTESWSGAARLVLDGLVTRARVRGVNTERDLVAGEPYIEIIRAVVGGGHDLVVVGHHELNGLTRLFLGSTAMKLLRDCPCPVWVAKRPMPERSPNILIATDLGPTSPVVLRYGTMLGELWDGRVYALHVLRFLDDPLGHGDLGEPDPATLHHHEEGRRTAENTVLAQLASVAGIDARRRCQLDFVSDVGDPARCIEQFVTKHEIDLLVLGTAARRSVAGYLIGNIAEALLPRANCSLLVAKAPNFQCIVL